MSAKDVRLRPITAKAGNDFIRRVHYSGKSTRNSQLHIGVFYHGSLHGAMQIGPPLDRSKLLPLVAGTTRTGMAELNRMAFDDVLPRNSESRALAIMARILRKQRPELKWLVSFADATACGDGTIYRASGMILTDIRRNNAILELPNGHRIHEKSMRHAPNLARSWLGGKTYYEMTGGSPSKSRFMEATGAIEATGFQLRYILFLDPTWRSKLTVPELPYSAIAEAGATMYKGSRVGSIDSDAPSDQQGTGRCKSDPDAPTLMDTATLMDTL